jgi:hypothetical protein
MLAPLLPPLEKRQVSSRQFAAFDAFPAAQRVTYKFYVGRLAVFDEHYVSYQNEFAVGST